MITSGELRELASKLHGLADALSGELPVHVRKLVVLLGQDPRFSDVTVATLQCFVSWYSARGLCRCEFKNIPLTDSGLIKLFDQMAGAP